MNHIYDTFIRKTEILSKALDKATERTRAMLYVVTFWSLLIMITSFNAYLSWDRKLNAKDRLLLAVELDLIPVSALKQENYSLLDSLQKRGYKQISKTDMDTDVAKTLRKIQQSAEHDKSVKKALEDYAAKLQEEGLILNQSDYFKLFFERQKFTIPILGLSCYVDDLYIIGGVGLLILLTYNFFSVRRENRIVLRISNSIDYIDESNPKEYLHDNTYKPDEIALIKHNLMEYIFYGCSEFFIFNTGLTTTDLITQGNGKKKKTNTSGRVILSFIYYLPIISMVFCLIFEVKSLWERHDFLTSATRLN